MTNKLSNKLQALFVEREGPQIDNIELFVHGENCDAAALVKIHVPDTISWFDGHFPEQAVLPGVVQIDWVGKIGTALIVSKGVFSKLSNIKFKSMVMPNTRLTVELIYQSEKGNLKFHLFDEKTSYSSGIMKFIVQ